MTSFILPRRPNLPSALGSRSLSLQKKANIRNTANTAAGFRPASLVVLHRSLVPAFERFCQANSGPLPLLSQSEPEKWMWLTLGAVPGIRFLESKLGSGHKSPLSSPEDPTVPGPGPRS
uniref:Uncharacterized protein n=1 Tax=Urocitellus parryii TaxID=9999 RepID=A0A8D2II72_UROPR